MLASEAAAPDTVGRWLGEILSASFDITLPSPPAESLCGELGLGVRLRT